MKLKTIVAKILLRGLSIFFSCMAADAAAHDARLQTIDYDPNQVVSVSVQRGFAVHISLGPNEHIEAAGTGDNSHCEDPSAQWCVVARRGDHDVYINVHEHAVPTNLFVKTDRRNYSFDLLPVGIGAKSHIRKVYLIQFDYPMDEMVQAKERAIHEQSIEEKQTLETRLASDAVPRNWNYTMQVTPGGEQIEPSMAYDDGRFTYLKFPNNREIPAIYMVNDDSTESILQWHVDHDIVVVHRVAKRFVLRDGTAVVGLWNEAYDVDGVGPHNGTTVPGVARELMPQGRASGVAAPSTQRIPDMTSASSLLPYIATQGGADSKLRSDWLNILDRGIQNDAP